MSRADAEPGADPNRQGWRVRARMRYLYHGSSPAAVRFRLAVIVVDFAIIGFFLAAPILREAGWAFYVLDVLVALILAADLTARALAYTDIKDWLKRPSTWIDLFILATLTTTGFGDITLPGNWGRVLSIIIMLTGITLFLRLAQTIVRPHKVRFPCPVCGLQKHDPDAVHCKACGETLCIPDEGHH